MSVGMNTDGKADSKYAPFVHRRRVAFHETDAMGVVHHSNHIKFFEEARVAMLRERGLIHYHSPIGPYTFAVLDASVRYLRTARFEEELLVWTEGQLDGSRIRFRYAIYSPSQAAWVADGTTTLVPLNPELKPVRLPPELRDSVRREPWSEVWPPSSDSRPPVA